MPRQTITIEIEWAQGDKHTKNTALEIMRMIRETSEDEALAMEHVESVDTTWSWDD